MANQQSTGGSNMIPYTRYYPEWNTPPEGIDTISIWVNPRFINDFSVFKHRGNNYDPINLIVYSPEKNGLKVGNLGFYIYFQSEVFSPDYSYYQQILNYLAEFSINGTLKKIRGCKNDKDVIVRSMDLCFNNFFSLNSLDFNFDLRDEDVELLGRAGENHQNTIYSGDRPSSIKTYNRAIKLAAKRSVPMQAICQMQFTRRIEIHLAHLYEQCKYLSPRNIDGTYEEVFNRFLPQLARKWFDHRDDVLCIPNLNSLPYAHHLRQIENLAYCGTVPQYKHLKPTPKRPKITKFVRKKEVDRNWIIGRITEN